MHVVERVETYDRISRNRFVTRYAYHHGYFDGVEREFRGFGMVEQWDTEELAALSASGTLPDADEHRRGVARAAGATPRPGSTPASIWAASTCPTSSPACSMPGSGEYYREPRARPTTQARSAAARLTPCCPTGLTADEEREACRALKGSMLRQEVYALDGTPRAAAPLHRHRAELHASAAAAARREPARGVLHPRARGDQLPLRAQPRPTRASQHALTLEVDAFGNVLKAAAVGYGPPSARRRAADCRPIEPSRRALLVTYTENDVTNAIDDVTATRRLPHAAAGGVAHLRADRLSTPGGGRRYRLQLRRDAYAAASAMAAATAEIAYETTPAGDGSAAKRLIEQRPHALPPRRPGAARTIRWHCCRWTACSRWRCPARATSSPSRPACWRRSSSATAQRAAARTRRRSAVAQGADGGGYVDLDGDGHWWIPVRPGLLLAGSRRHAAAQELAYARQHFFLPHRYRDPFGADVSRARHLRRLRPAGGQRPATRSATGSPSASATRRHVDTAEPGNDYRVLQPGW